MSDNFRVLLERIKAETEDVFYIDLPVSESKLQPILSKKNIDLHYGVLYKNYVKNALAGEGDFQIAGARLHTLFFSQFQEPKTNNKPFGPISYFIDDKFGSFENFKSEIIEKAKTLHGSGWVYLDVNGNIKLIENHKIVSDVLIILDMWEHAYVDDYRSNKEKYLRDIFNIINWGSINLRI